MCASVAAGPKSPGLHSPSGLPGARSSGSLKTSARRNDLTIEAREDPRRNEKHEKHLKRIGPKGRWLACTPAPHDEEIKGGRRCCLCGRARGHRLARARARTATRIVDVLCRTTKSALSGESSSQQRSRRAKSACAKTSLRLRALSKNPTTCCAVTAKNARKMTPDSHAPPAGRSQRSGLSTNATLGAMPRLGSKVEPKLMAGMGRKLTLGNRNRRRTGASFVLAFV